MLFSLHLHEYVASELVCNCIALLVCNESAGDRRETNTGACGYIGEANSIGSSLNIQWMYTYLQLVHLFRGPNFVGYNKTTSPGFRPSLSGPLCVHCNEGLWAFLQLLLIL